LLLSYFSQRGWADCKGEYRSTQGDWLLDTFNSTWAVFEKRFLEQWNEQGVRDDCGGLSPAILFGAGVADGANALKAHQGAYMKQIWEDSLGFAGAEMIRRIIGIAHVADLDEIPDADIRALCERAALMCGRELMLNAKKLTPASIVDVVKSQEFAVFAI